MLLLCHVLQYHVSRGPTGSCVRIAHVSQGPGWHFQGPLVVPCLEHLVIVVRDLG